MRKAIFLDRDGTINEDAGDICSLREIVFTYKAIEALKRLQKKYLLFIITNQSGIGKGMFSEKKFLRFNNEYLRLLKKKNVKIQQVYYCPHNKEENCLCRKPSTYFIEGIKKKYQLDLSASYCIGDHPHDMEMACRSGTRAIYLLSGHGRKHFQELSVMSEFIALNLFEAAAWILGPPDSWNNLKELTK
jgi:D-glycero-D-manno-heptose 1,7-bisphosphate phosphatase